MLRATGRGPAGGLVLRCDTRLHPQKRATPLQFAFYQYSRPVRGFDWAPELTVPDGPELDAYWCEAATASRSVRKRSPWMQEPDAGERAPRAHWGAAPRRCPGRPQTVHPPLTRSPPRPPTSIPVSHLPGPLSSPLHPHPCTLPLPPLHSPRLHASPQSLSSPLHPPPRSVPRPPALPPPLATPWFQLGPPVAFTASPGDETPTFATAAAPGAMEPPSRKPPMSQRAEMLPSVPSATPAAGGAPTAGPPTCAPQEPPGVLSADMAALLREMRALRTLLARALQELGGTARPEPAEAPGGPTTSAVGS